MSSMNVMITKLLKALEQNGIIYCLDKRQYYSEQFKKRCTKYKLHRTYEDEDGEKIRENYEFSKQLDVVFFLSDQLNLLGGVKT